MHGKIALSNNGSKVIISVAIGYYLKKFVALGRKQKLLVIHRNILHS